jgi:hypothetical protein
LANTLNTEKCQRKKYQMFFFEMLPAQPFKFRIEADI